MGGLELGRHGEVDVEAATKGTLSTTALTSPMMSTMMRNSRLTSVSNDLLGSLMNARTEAVKRQSQVVLCATPDATATPPGTCTSAGSPGIYCCSP